MSAVQPFKEYLMETQSNFKTLYVHRPILNADAVRSWAKDQGFTSTLHPDDMHTTIAYSKEKVDWSQLHPMTGTFECHDHHKKVQKLGDKGAVVLMYESMILLGRWRQLLDHGATWDYPEYHPHVSISYTGAPKFDLGLVIPYDGPLVLGPEVFRALDEDWVKKMEELPL
jgi:hypothetical protein